LTFSLILVFFFLENIWQFIWVYAFFSFLDGGGGVVAAGDGADAVPARLQPGGHLVRCLLVRPVAHSALTL
jgi:hypothetical protein